MQIALALYPKFTVLDIIGPFQVLADVPGHEVVFVAGKAGPVVDHTGRCPLVASTTFAEVTAPDVVVVPGELFADWDDSVVEWLRQVHPTTTWTTSVCTGSLYLAGAGILDGVDATTHWARKEQLERLGARYTEQRVVERGKVITAAGVPVAPTWHSPCSTACTARPSRRACSWPSNTTPSRPSMPVHPRRPRPTSSSSPRRLSTAPPQPARPEPGDLAGPAILNGRHCADGVGVSRRASWRRAHSDQSAVMSGLSAIVSRSSASPA
jgi:putative intracellular protease/amidase